MKDFYDIAIIGGGIAGAGIARDAALRGFKVVLFEKNTFGSGASGKSSKLIHGGIRYLEIAFNALLQGNFREFIKNLRFVFLALRETHTLSKMAPNLIKPLPLILPIYKGKGRSKWEIWFGTFLYYFLARVTGPTPCPEILWNAKAVLKKIPNLNPEALRGGILFWDHTTDDQKLVQTTIHSACGHGAEAYEHAAVLKYELSNFPLGDRSANKTCPQSGKIYEVTVQMDGQSKTVKARKIINASGSWIDKVRETSEQTVNPWIIPVAGSHIEFERFTNYSVLLQASDKRIFFIIDRGKTSRVGTTEWLNKDPDHLETPEQDVKYLLENLRAYFPSENLEEKSIVSKDSGIRPLAKPCGNVSLNAISREHEFRKSADGVIHVLGVKLTDYRRAAEELVNGLVKELRSDVTGLDENCRTTLEPLNY